MGGPTSSVQEDHITLKDCVNVGTEQQHKALAMLLWERNGLLQSRPTSQGIGLYLKPEEPGMELGARKVFLQRRAVERRC